MHEPKVEPLCIECRGQTVEFRGSGTSTEKRICSRWQEPGHLTKAEIERELSRVYRMVRPSGRFG